MVFVAELALSIILLLLGIWEGTGHTPQGAVVSTSLLEGLYSHWICVPPLILPVSIFGTDFFFWSFKILIYFWCQVWSLWVIHGCPLLSLFLFFLLRLWSVKSRGVNSNGKFHDVIGKTTYHSYHTNRRQCQLAKFYHFCQVYYLSKGKKLKNDTISHLHKKATQKRKINNCSSINNG